MNSRQVIKEFNRVLSGSIAIDELKDWVFSHLQEALDTSDEKTIRWMDEANILLMELNDGVVDEEEFMQSIDAIVRESESFVKQWLDSGEVIFINSGNVTIGQKATFNLLVSDLPLSDVVFV